MELESQAFEALEGIGIRENQTVLDFGCGSGMYTIQAARIVGEEGRVYALDKDREALGELIQKAESVGLSNIEGMETSGEPEIELADESVDRVLLFDVLHSYYFSQADERRRLLNEIHRVMKPTALLLLWPKHMESEAEDEVKKAAFRLEKELSETLIHDRKTIEKGKILSFRKD
jgi:ubiquinone/menaquinone biosynthesis C-methylase UbiE